MKIEVKIKKGDPVTWMTIGNEITRQIPKELIVKPKPKTNSSVGIILAGMRKTAAENFTIKVEIVEGENPKIAKLLKMLSGVHTKMLIIDSKDWSISKKIFLQYHGRYVIQEIKSELKELQK